MKKLTKYLILPILLLLFSSCDKQEIVYEDMGYVTPMKVSFEGIDITQETGGENSSSRTNSYFGTVGPEGIDFKIRYLVPHEIIDYSIYLHSSVLHNIYLNNELVSWGNFISNDGLQAQGDWGSISTTFDIESNSFIMNISMTPNNTGADRLLGFKISYTTMSCDVCLRQRSSN